MRTQHVQTRTVPADDDARDRLVARAPVTQRRLSLSGASTALLEAGGGPPPVLLHHGIEDAGDLSPIEQPQAFLHALRLLLQGPTTGEATRS